MTPGPETVPDSEERSENAPDWDSAVTVDARGLTCPQPLLAMRRARREQPRGTLLRVLATDAGSWRDFHSYAELSSTPLLRAERRGDCYYYWLYAESDSGNLCSQSSKAG